MYSKFKLVKKFFKSDLPGSSPAIILFPSSGLGVKGPPGNPSVKIFPLGLTE